jgi:type VI secretion system protein ImpH
MANAPRHEIDALEQRLLTQAQRFDARQALRLLYRFAEQQGLRAASAVRIRPALSLELNRPDIVNITHRDEQGYDVWVSFLGLYGSSSPLPTFYSEDLIAQELEDRGLAKAFIDILQQRVYDLFLQAIDHYHPHRTTVEKTQSRYPSLLAGLTGLRDPRLRALFPNPWQCLPYLGLLASSRRSAAGLQALLSHALNKAPVEIVQCVERWVKIPTPQRLALGISGGSLGETALLGDALLDCNGKIQIRIGPLTANRFNQLLNHGEEWSLLVSLTQYYLNIPLACELALQLYPGEAQSAELGSPSWGQLGNNTWLFAGEHSNGAATAQLQLA